MIQITGFLHASVAVSNLKTAREFYEGLLGLEPSPARPNMNFDGAWYDIGLQQIHLLELPNPEFGLERPAHVGRDRHVALRIADLDALRDALDQAKIPYTHSQSGRRALFCRDPDGNGLEFSE
jgi:glyoxylase I family protein